ncbi:MAG: aminopeptidase P family N-terminal domain-containing protein, partial [Nocardioidaceae bacterium]
MNDPSTVARAFEGQEPPADSTEYAHRAVRVRTAMARRSLAALVVTDPANIFYLTGYDA